MQHNIKYAKRVMNQNNMNQNNMNQNNMNQNNMNHLLYPIKDMINQLENNMFTQNNLSRFTENIYVSNAIQNETNSNINGRNKNKNSNSNIKFEIRQKTNPNVNDEYFKPRQKDSLFWCFYVLKYGFSKYEMEVGNQHFVIEKQEKFKYIELMRASENKALLKMYKIKPLNELEDDLANKPQISIKTFFALCVIEKINILLIDKRKVYECMCNDSGIVNVIHKNSIPLEYYIELNNDKNPEKMTNKIKEYNETYYKMPNFEGALKSVSSYKVDELLDISKKLDINLTTDKKKLTKGDMYELIVSNL